RVNSLHRRRQHQALDAQAIIDKIQADTKAGLADPALRAKMAQLAADPVGGTPAELAAFLQAEMKKWGDLIKEIGAKAE
ncbi:MAG: hypothetical protein ACOVOI_20365, partial [Hyphomicrobiales bacterium]